MPLTAQEVTDTIEVTIRGRLTDVMITSELVTPPTVGDSVIFVALAFDEEGNPMTAGIAFFWASSDPTRLQITERPDGSALGVALRQGTVRVWVRAEMVEVMQIASFRPPDSLNWTLQDDSPVGVPLQYCAYLTRNNELVLQSQPPPTCPIVFLAPTEPPNSVWANLYRVRPYESILRIGDMLGTEGSDTEKGVR
jgi:hypothetical protein